MSRSQVSYCGKIRDNNKAEGAFFDEIENILIKQHIRPRYFSEFEEIIVQYCNICTKNKISDWKIVKEDFHGFNFLTFLDMSLSFCNHLPVMFKLMQVINNLTRQWDLQINRLGRHQNIPASHRFFLARSATSYSHTKMFYYKDNPDVRLCCIFIEPSASLQDALFITLHEVGHFIGCRIRDIRQDYCRHLAISALSLEVYQICCAKMLFTDDMHCFPIKLNEDCNLSNQIAESSSQIRKSIEQRYFEISAIFKQNYEAMKEYQKSPKEPKLTNENSKYSIYMKELFATVNCVVRKSLPAIRDLFPVNSCDGHGINQQIIEAIQSIETEEREKQYYPWLMTCTYQLSEPAADVFMVNMARIKARDYILNILNHAWNRWSHVTAEKSPKSSYLQFVANDVMRTRVLAICTVLSATPADFNKTRYYDKKKRTAINSALKMFFNMYQELLHQEQGDKPSHSLNIKQVIWNPQHIISWYTKEIYRDKFYNDFIKEHEDILNELQTFYVPNRLAHFFLYRLYRLHAL